MAVNFFDHPGVRSFKDYHLNVLKCSYLVKCSVKVRVH